MKKLGKLVAGAMLLSTLGGCAYGGVGVTADGKAVIARNDSFLFGALRTVFVCKVTDGGLTSCAEGDAP